MQSKGSSVTFTLVSLKGGEELVLPFLLFLSWEFSVEARFVWASVCSPHYPHPWSASLVLWSLNMLWQLATNKPTNNEIWCRICLLYTVSGLCFTKLSAKFPVQSSPQPCEVVRRHRDPEHRFPKQRQDCSPHPRLLYPNAGRLPLRDEWSKAAFVLRPVVCSLQTRFI